MSPGNPPIPNTTADARDACGQRPRDAGRRGAGGGGGGAPPPRRRAPKKKRVGGGACQSPAPPPRLGPPGGALARPHAGGGCVTYTAVRAAGAGRPVAPAAPAAPADPAREGRAPFRGPGVAPSSSASAHPAVLPRTQQCFRAPSSASAHPAVLPRTRHPPSNRSAESKPSSLACPGDAPNDISMGKGGKQRGGAAAEACDTQLATEHGELCSHLGLRQGDPVGIP
eukprot:gene13177-biopygen3078